MKLPKGFNQEMKDAQKKVDDALKNLPKIDKAIDPFPMGWNLSKLGQMKIKQDIHIENQQMRIRLYVQNQELATQLIETTINNHGEFFLEFIADKLASGIAPEHILSII